MSVAERAKKLHEALDELLYSKPKESIALIEQALLAERRLAMEEAAKIAEHRHEVHGWDDCQCHETAEAIRAAAEKEVGK